MQHPIIALAMADRRAGKLSANLQLVGFPSLFGGTGTFLEGRVGLAAL